MKTVALIAIVMSVLLCAGLADALSIFHDPNPVSDFGDTYFVISWSTNAPSLSNVGYGTSVSPTSQAQNNTPTQAHSVRVDGLQPNTVYYYNILSIAPDGASAIDDNNGNYYSVRTGSKADSTPPRITNVTVENTAPTTALVHWLTDEASNSTVWYGTARQSASDSALTTEHTVQIDVAKDTSYALIVGSCDASANCINATGGFYSGAGALLNVSIPAYTKFNEITLTGTTVPLASVKVIVNGQLSRATVAAGDGTFTFQDIRLGGPSATITVGVRDQNGNTAEQSGTVVSDNVPPIVTFTQAIPDYLADNTLTLSGSVSEPVTFTYGVTQTGAAPARITDMSTAKVTGNTVSLQWSAVDNAASYAIYRDKVRVAVVTAPQFTDSVSANSFYMYRVSGISKACQEGDMSDELKVQTNPTGLSVNVTPVEVPIQCGTPAQTMQVSGQFSFSIPLTDGENDVYVQATDRAGNTVRYENTTTVDTVAPQFLDNNLQLLSPTYTPLVEVNGRLNKQGTVLIYLNKDTPIAVLTNKDGTFSKQIELSRDVTLQTTKSATPAVVGEMAQGWTNTVTLVAKDLAGRNVSVGPAQIVYSLCGYGSSFSVVIGKPLPDVLTPRLILEGVQQAGFSVNASYRGNRELARNGVVTVSEVPLSADLTKQYDHDMVHLNYLSDPRNPTNGYVQLTFVPQDTPTPGNNKTVASRELAMSDHRKGNCTIPGMGCIKLMLEIDVKATEKVPKQYGDTRIQSTAEPFLLNDISQKTCVNVELQIDKSLQLQQAIPKKFLQNSIDFLTKATDLIDTVLDPMITVGTYTTYGCMAMNGVLFGMFFSERYTCDFANIQDKGVIGALETALGKGTPIRTIAEIGMCESVFSDAAGAAVGTAGTGTPPPQSRLQAYQACKKCQDAISRRKTIENDMRVICDRVACPSAPTLQTYIRDNQKQPPKQVVLGTASSTVTTPNAINGLIYDGNSCGFKGQGGMTLSVGYSSLTPDTRTFKVTDVKNGKAQGFQRVVAGQSATVYTASPTPGKAVDASGTTYSVDPKGNVLGANNQIIGKLQTPADKAASLPTADEQAALAAFSTNAQAGQQIQIQFGSKGIKEIYLDYLKHEKDKAREFVAPVAGTTTVGAPAKIDCAGLHPANPECCGYEYYQEWGSACGIPGVLETFDELKESACLAATNANQIPDLQTAAQQVEGNPKNIQCKSLFNSVAGFCEPNSGAPVGDTIPTGIRYSQADMDALAAPDLNEIYIRIEPMGVDNNQYKVIRGYIRKRITQSSTALTPAQQQRMQNETAAATALRQGKATDAPGQFYLNADLDFVPDIDPGADLTQYFQDTEETRKVPQGQLPPGFSNALCAHAADANACTGSQSRTVYQNIKSKMGVSDQIYIVRPDRDGILRSTQCMCLPAVTSYLSFWKNVLTAVRGCLQTVEITGDAQAGVCKAVLSQYVCDMLWDVLSCFTQKYSSPGYGSEFGGRGGIGDVLGSLSAAGGDMQRSINSRYGDTALWKSMFVDRQLLHSICAFAFTGTWDLDISGVYKQAVNDIPLKTEGFLYPADRRFISYNPTTSPAGLPTFTYHFGVGLIAGEDIRYDLTLKCSNSLRCEPRDGFVSGKCDCFGHKEQLLPVTSAQLGTGTMKKNDILNAEVFYTLQGMDAQSGVRYDTAILSWESLNPLGGVVQRGSVPVPIHVIGQSPPNFCQFDPLALMYRCNIGIGDYTGARFTTISPVLPQGSPVVTVGKPLQFSVGVNLQYPSDAQQQSNCVAGTCPYTKWINYEIKNQNSQTIAGPLKPEQVVNNPDLKVEAQGETVKTVTIKTLTEGDFSFAQSVTSNIVQGGVNDFAFTTPTKIPNAQIQRAFVLVVTQKDTKYSYEVFAAGGGPNEKNPTPYAPRDKPLSDGQWGYFKKGALLSNVTEIPTVTVSTVKLDQFGIQFTPNIQQKLDQPAEYFIPADVTPGQPGQSVCDQYKLSGANWTATFKLYDSTAIAGGTAYQYNALQPTVDPSTGQVQSLDVNFGVVCASSYQGAGGSVPACPADPTQQITSQCFCGSADELAAAQARYLADKTAVVLNCGVGFMGNYCVYNDVSNTSAGRRCWTQPGTKPAAQPGTTTATTTTSSTPPREIDVQGYMYNINGEGIYTEGEPITGQNSFTFIPGHYTVRVSWNAGQDFSDPRYTVDTLVDDNAVKAGGSAAAPEGDLLVTYGMLFDQLNNPSKVHTLKFRINDGGVPSLVTKPLSFKVISPIRLLFVGTCDDTCTATNNAILSDLSVDNRRLYALPQKVDAIPSDPARTDKWVADNPTFIVVVGMTGLPALDWTNPDQKDAFHKEVINYNSYAAKLMIDK